MSACAGCGAASVEGARFCSYCGAALDVGLHVATRKTVTILFCDLSEFTPFGERLDPETQHEVMRRYFRTMEGIIVRHEGHVEKFIGDAIMAVFGVPRLHEDDALRAARCALEMREAVEVLNTELRTGWGETLHVRYGIATGEVAFAGVGAHPYFALGDAVNTAQRLERAAALDEILIGRETARLIGRAARLEPLEPLELKGKSAPVAAWRLLGVAPPAGAMPRGGSAEHVVGRDTELQVLHDELAETVTQRRCRAVTVLGAAGVGKSCLVRRFVHDVEHVAPAVFGRCLSYGEGITLLPLAEAVSQLAGDATETAITAFLGGGREARQVAAHVSGAVGFAAGGSPNEERQWAFRRLLEIAASRGPLILVMEDIHWAEPVLLDLLEHVVSGAREVPLLVVCLARPELRRRPPGPVVELVPLSEPDSRRLLDWLDPDTAGDAADRARLLAMAEGNPFYLEQLVAVRQETGAIGTMPVPIQAVLAARIDGLPAEERAVIDCAAIEGRRFHRSAVSELVGPARRMALDAALVSLVRRDLVRPDRPDVPGEDGYRFAHILVRDAVYALLPKARRVGLHERFAQWLEGRTVEDRRFGEIIGFHYEQAHRCSIELQPVKHVEHERLGRAGARHLGTVGDAAFARGDPSAAVGLFERALALLEIDDPERGPLLTEFGAALTHAGRLRDAKDALDAAIEGAEERGDPVGGARAEVCLLSVRLQDDTEAAAPEILRRFDELLGSFSGADDAVGLTRLWRLQALVQWMAGRSDLAEAAWEAAVEHATRAGDEQGRTDALCWLASSAFTGPLHALDGIARCERIRGQLSGNRRAESFLLQPLAGLWAMLGQFADARRLLAESNATLADLGVSMHDAVPYHEAFVELLGGNPAGAEAALRAGYERLREMGEKALFADTAATLARVVYAQDRLDEAEALAHEAARDAAPADLAPQFGWRMVRAAVLARRGEGGEAVRLTSDALRLVERTDWLNDRADVLAGHANALAAIGDERASRKALDEAIALYQRKGNTVAAESLREALERPAMTVRRTDGTDEVKDETAA